MTERGKGHIGETLYLRQSDSMDLPQSLSPADSEHSTALAVAERKQSIQVGRAAIGALPVHLFLLQGIITFTTMDQYGRQNNGQRETQLWCSPSFSV